MEGLLGQNSNREEGQWISAAALCQAFTTISAHLIVMFFASLPQVDVDLQFDMPVFYMVKNDDGQWDPNCHPTLKDNMEWLQVTEDDMEHRRHTVLAASFNEKFELLWKPSPDNERSHNRHQSRPYLAQLVPRFQAPWWPAGRCLGQRQPALIARSSGRAPSSSPCTRWLSQ